MFLHPSISEWMHLGLSSKLWASGNKLHPGPQALSRMVSGMVWSWLLICPGARAPSWLHSGRHDGAVHGKCSSSYSLFSLGTLRRSLWLLHCSDHSSRDLWWDSTQRHPISEPQLLQATLSVERLNNSYHTWNLFEAHHCHLAHRLGSSALENST